MKFLILSAFFLSLSISSKSQSVDECRYLMTLTYLRTNTQINERIKGLFSRINITKKKDKYVEFNLSNRIDFISIYDFKEELNSLDIGISKELINDYKLYSKKFLFESFSSEFLKKLIQPNNSKLFLTFSKPVGNYVVALIANSNPNINGTTIFGLGIKMLFKFDSSGLIEDVLYSSSAYN